MTPLERSLTYRDAGVDIEAGDTLVEAIKPIVKSTLREGVIGNIGGFGGLFEIPKGYKQPVLVSGTDGVGTKLKLAFDLDRHDTIGIDLVAMCANDVLVQGAEPLFFLDYFATGKLSIETAESVIRGIARGCQLAGAALIGGETAEMPGMYSPGEYDLAGFCVGVVEKSAIIDGAQVKEGDQLIGLASSGPHSNGYSLIRKLIEVQKIDLQADFSETTLGQALLQPTQIYVKPVLELIRQIPVRAIAHITGGGIPGNIVRILPDHLHAVLSRSRWTQPEIFSWIQTQGQISDDEMLRTFNCGLGMVIIVPESHLETGISILKTHNVEAWGVGVIQSRGAQEAVRVES